MTASPDLAALLDSWQLCLRAERKSPQTVKSYSTGVSQYLAWCRDSDLPLVLDRRQLAGFTDYVLDNAQPATARVRQLGVKRFSAWLVEEGEQVTDHLLGVKPPKLDTKVVEPLTETQIKAMLKACAGPDLRDRRDEAILRLMVETGARAGEVAALAVADVDLMAGTAIVR
nr:tyrosine-type recombinase/integrase [Nocardioidaceae bacterium]